MGTPAVRVAMLLLLVSGPACHRQSSPFETIAFPDGLQLEQMSGSAEMPDLLPGECNASSFRLSPAATAALWPDGEGWHLSGWMIRCERPGLLAFDLVEPRHGDRSFAHFECEVSGASRFVFGYRMSPQESPAEVGAFQVLASSMRVFVRKTIPDWARPAAMGELVAGWSQRSGGLYHIKSGDSRLLETWSWNGHHTDARAELKHSNPDGQFVPPLRMRTVVIEDDPKFESLPLDQWREPVWFIRVRYDAR